MKHWAEEILDAMNDPAREAERASAHARQSEAQRASLARRRAEAELNDVKLFDLLDLKANAAYERHKDPEYYTRTRNYVGSTLRGGTTRPMGNRSQL